MANDHFLSAFPDPGAIKKSLGGNNLPAFRESNGHIHTPYSFSAFNEMRDIFLAARKENIAVLGINDFYVTEGYNSFLQGSLKYQVFPLFNIEFIGLMKNEQREGVRINDPNNPGRIYFSGKGLDYPFNTGWATRRQLNKMIRESQKQMKAMVSKLNQLIVTTNPTLYLSYDDIKKRFARELVRERHLARAVRMLSSENYPGHDEQKLFLESLYGGKTSGALNGNNAALENEIRANLLKNGGPAFVQEDDKAFPDIKKIIRLIIKAGGIPCYPVLLDDPSGRLTEFESNREKLSGVLSGLNVGCIELIPGRNDLNTLREFVRFFDEKGFLVIFGTEHNTPEMAPLTITARGGEELDEELKQIAWNSVCVIAAHQYLRAQGRQGYVLPDGKTSIQQRRELAYLGRLVIEYFLHNKPDHDS